MGTYRIIACVFVLITFFLASFILVFLSKAQKGVERDWEKDTKRARGLAVAILVVSVLAAIGFWLFKDNSLYRVLDVYDKGVGVRCLTDDEHATTALTLSKDKASKIKEFDLIDSKGNVIVSGVWFSSEADEVAETSQP